MEITEEGKIKLDIDLQEIVAEHWAKILKEKGVKIARLNLYNDKIDINLILNIENPNDSRFKVRIKV